MAGKGHTEGRILVTGASGFLGRFVLEALSGAGEIWASRRPGGAPVPQGAAAVELDLADGRGLDAVAALEPRFVVHAAALSDPDRCEAEPELAEAVNVRGTARLAEAVAPSCERFVFCSTDLVFGGDEPPYGESDPPRPRLRYGATKRDAETLVLEALAGRAVVLRLALLYGPDPTGKSFLVRLVDAARRGRPVPLFVDQIRTPLYVGDAARAIARLLALPAAPRVLHAGGPERVSRYAMGRAALEAFGIPAEGIARPVRTAAARLRAPRPVDVSLDTSEARRRGFRFRPLREGLEASRALWDRTPLR